MREICQSHLPQMPWTDARSRNLPGTSAISPDDWLCRDDVFDAQMAYRHELLSNNRDAVYGALTESETACIALCAMMDVTPIEEEPPLITAAKTVQEDLLILEKSGCEHILTAGVLCFPASWTLSEKIGRPMTRIHAPVPGYESQISKRVQTMLDNLKDDRPIARANFLIYDTPELHHPLREGEHRPVSADGPHWVRVERQTLRKINGCEAVIFTLHTYIQRVTDLPQDAFESLANLRPQIRIR